MAINHQPAADGDMKEPIIHAGLALLKGMSGALLGSAAVLSDAFRSAGDACGSYLSRRGSAEKMSRRFKLSGGEHAAAYLFSILLMLIGLEIAMLAVQNMLSPLDEFPEWPAAFAVPVCLALRLWLVRSQVSGTEWLSSLIAASGSGAAWAGGEQGVEWMLYLDPLASAIIGIIIVCKGYGLIMQNGKGRRAERAIDAELTGDVMELVQRVDGVVTVESVQQANDGGKLTASIVISVNPRITVLEGGDIARRVKLLVQKRFLQIVEVKVSVEPYNPGYPYKSNHDPNQDHIPTLLQ